LQANGTAIVVGASICGMTCALALAKQGRRVRVLEARSDPQGQRGRDALASGALEIAAANAAVREGRDEQARAHFRAADRTRASVWGTRNRNLLFDRHSLEFLRGLGARVEDLPALAVLDTHLGPGQPSICIRYGRRLSQGGLGGRLDAATMIAQRDPVAVPPIAEVELMLRRAARADPNIDIEYDAQVVACSESDEEVSVSFAAPRLETIVADLVVIADGASRRSLSRQLGIGRIEAGSETMNIAAFEVDPSGVVLGHSLSEGWLDARTTPEGWVVFLSSGRGLLTVNTRRVGSGDAPTAVALAAQAGVAGILLEEPASHTYALDRAARFTSGSRVLVVGDAACRTSPAWAFGAQYALLWAQMVADLCSRSPPSSPFVLDPDRLAAFEREAERITNMRLEFERSVIRFVDLANADVRKASDLAISGNFMSAIHELELDFRTLGPHLGSMAIRLSVDLEELIGASDTPDLAAFCRAVGRFDVGGRMRLRFDQGRGEGTADGNVPIEYRTRLELIRLSGGTVSVERRDTGYWAFTMTGVDLRRTARSSGNHGLSEIERAELRLPDEFVTQVLHAAGPQLWALGAARKQPLQFEVELRPGPFRIGTFTLRLQGAPLARVTLSSKTHGARLSFTLRRGTATVEGFSTFVRRTPLKVTRPLRLWQTLMGGLADPFVDFWAAGASRFVRRADFDVYADGTGKATYHFSGVPVIVPMTKADVQTLITKLLDSASCEQIMRQYQRSVATARIGRLEHAEQRSST
jgi:2-polyprenyl-6-methoxyphenol hydroxylase-like FAD-dependent oxidoreductase